MQFVYLPIQSKTMRLSCTDVPYLRPFISKFYTLEECIPTEPNAAESRCGNDDTDVCAGSRTKK